MTINQLAIGPHDAEGGGRMAPDLKDYFRRLNENGIPFAYKNVGGNPTDAQEIAREYPEIPNVVVYRFGGVHTGYDVPDYFKDAKTSAEEFWEKHKAKFPPELDKDIVWVETLNEVETVFEIDVTGSDEPSKMNPYPMTDGRWVETYVNGDGRTILKVHNESWFGRFAGVTAELVVQDGYKWLAYGFAAGTPEPDFWRDPKVVNFLQFAGRNPDRIGIALHEYTYRLGVGESVFDDGRGLVGRFVDLVDFAQNELAIDLTIVMTEWGWNDRSAPDYGTARAHLAEVAPLYLKHGVKGLMLWHVGSGNWGGLQSTVNGYFPRITDDILRGVIPTKAVVASPELPEAPQNPEPPDYPDTAFDVFDYPVTHVLHPTFDKMSLEAKAWLDDAVRNGVQLPGVGRRIVGFSGWTHRDPIDAITLSTANGHPSRLIILEGENIGSNLGPEWIEANFPHISDYVIFIDVDSDEVEPPAAETPFVAWPTQRIKAISQSWGNRPASNPNFYAAVGPGHEGIDIPEWAYGTVHAVNSGVVVHASRYMMTSGSRESAYGYHVVIDHGEYATLYAHLLVGSIPFEGQRVAAGQEIGKIAPGKQTSGEKSSGPHLHFSLLVPNAPENGWVQTPYGRYVDPTAYLDASLPLPESTTTPSKPVYSGPQLEPGFRRFLGQPASSWNWSDKVKELFRSTGLIPFFYTGGDNARHYGEFKQPNGFNICRILLNPATPVRTAEGLFSEIIADVRQMYALGVRNFTLFNEPNLYLEGLGLRYSSGIEYGNQIRELAKLLKGDLPGVRLWMTPMSPGPSIDGIRYDSELFMAQIEETGAFSEFYGFACHAYTVIGNNVQAATAEVVDQVIEFQAKYALNKPIFVAEFAVVNGSTSGDYKSRVYEEIYKALEAYSGIQGASAFTSDWWGGQNPEGWGKTRGTGPGQHPDGWDSNKESWTRLGIRVNQALKG